MIQQEDVLIINGKRYVHIPEENKRDRLHGWISSDKVKDNGQCFFTIFKTECDDMHLVEIKDDEIIVSKKEFKKAFYEATDCGETSEEDLLKELGFK
jgi:hypothetical protein